MKSFWSNAEPENEAEELEKHLLELEEAGVTISAASRLLTKLLDSESFRQTVDVTLFTELLRKILRSNLPLHYKDWVASCLVKLTSLSSSSPSLDNPVNVEVCLVYISSDMFACFFYSTYINNI